ncbi:MAG TPA: hypothetical protein EYN54_14435 [Methylococcaceae bacterium]|nr:hypothetical protein [Methylococcaceae bacterium]
MSKPIAELRLVGDKIGREGMALMAREFIEQSEGSYKDIMELCGKLSVIAKMATCDDYWEEQVSRGIQRAELRVEREEIK